MVLFDLDKLFIYMVIESRFFHCFFYIHNVSKLDLDVIVWNQGKIQLNPFHKRHFHMLQDVYNHLERSSER